MLPLFAGQFRPHIYSRWIAFGDASKALGFMVFVVLIKVMESPAKPVKPNDDVPAVPQGRPE
jgi:hypothetical protein